MRRFLVGMAVLAVFAVCAAPAAAQVSEHRWFLHAEVGPAFGTFGSTPVLSASSGVRFGKGLALTGEVGALPRGSFDKAATIAPAPPVIAAQDDVSVNSHHVNANLLFHPGGWGPLRPYVTGGVGAFTGSTVARGTVGDTRISAYRDATNPSTNLGAGVRYGVTNWLGVNVDYRHFFVHADDLRHVNRFGTGVTFYLR